MGRRGAQQSRHPLHSRERGRGGGRDLPGAVHEFPNGTRAERAAWKYGWWTLQDRQPRRDDPGLRERGRDLPALRLPALVPLLGGAGARQERHRRARARRGCGSSIPTTPTPTTAGWPKAICGRAGLLPKGDRPRTARRRRRRSRAAGARQRRDHPAPARDRSLRRCDQRAAVCAARRRAIRR